MPFPLVLGCDRPLVGVDADNSMVVQKTPHLFFLLSPRGTCTPREFPEHHALRQSRILHTRHKPREQDPLLAPIPHRGGKREEREGPVSTRTRFSLGVENERAGAGRDD